MTLENVLTLVIILVLLVIAVREWMDILKRHPIFLTIVGVLITAYGLGPEFVNVFATIFKVVGIAIGVMIAVAFLAALDEVKNNK